VNNQMSSSKIIISSKMVKAMGKINDNDFIPILQGFERHIKCLKIWNENLNNLEEYKKGNSMKGHKWEFWWYMHNIVLYLI
jgi:pyruvate dehydrogenase complex dehydrogenase (E1) component